MKDTFNEQEILDQSVAGVVSPDPLTKDRQTQVQQGYGAMTIAMFMAGGAREDGKEPRAVTYARMFCILFAMLLPSLLLIRVVL